MIEQCVPYRPPSALLPERLLWWHTEGGHATVATSFGELGGDRKVWVRLPRLPSTTHKRGSNG